MNSTTSNNNMNQSSILLTGGDSKSEEDDQLTMIKDIPRHLITDNSIKFHQPTQPIPLSKYLNQRQQQLQQDA